MLLTFGAPCKVLRIDSHGQSKPVNERTKSARKRSDRASNNSSVASIPNLADALTGFFVFMHEVCTTINVQLGLTVRHYMNLDLQVLVDLLVIHTNEYNRIVTSPVFRVEEFTQCKRQLAEIHAAIKDKSKEKGVPMEHILPNFPENFSKVEVPK